jgi:Flp pilus assembly protein TadD
MKKLAVCLLLAVAIGSVYYNALSNGFIFDDYLLIVNRSALPQMAANPTLAFDLKALGYRPLRTLSYVLDYRLGGLNPWIFHLSNLVYHWLTACLVFLVTFRLVANEKAASSQLPVASLSDSGLRTADCGLRTALFAALLWALHPIQTDAVTYISGRRDILTGLFFFLGLSAFLRLRVPNSTLRVGGYVVWGTVAFLAYGLGLLSKEMAVTLPVVMLCYDFVYAVQLQEMGFGWNYMRELGRGVGRTIWQHKYLYVPLLAGAAYFSWYAAVVVLPTWRVGWYGGSLVNNVLTTARIWVYYLYLLLWPLRLLADYTGAFAVTRSLFDPWAWLAVALLFALFVATIGVLRYSRLVAFAMLWFAITLLPVSHLIPYPEMMAEHYLYIPSFGFCLLVALVFARLTESPRSKVQGPRSFFSFFDLGLGTWDLRRWRVVAGYTLLVIILAGYAWRTVVRNRDWRDDLTFYSRLVADNPHSARALLGLGLAYDHRGLPRVAIQQYSRGLRIDPRDPRLYTNLGAAHQKLGELDYAERAYQTALKMGFRDSAILNNLGFLYTEQREFDKARAALERAEKLSTGKDPAIYANWGLWYEVQKKLPEALEKYRKAKDLDPENEVFAQKIAELERKMAQLSSDGQTSSAKGEIRQ